MISNEMQTIYIERKRRIISIIIQKQKTNKETNNKKIKIKNKTPFTDFR